MTTKTGSDWEKEFDKRFVRNGEVGGSLEVAGESAEEIKAFITNFQEQTREEEREEIITTLKKFIVESNDPDWQGDDNELLAYNTGVQDCINQVTSRVAVSTNPLDSQESERK